MPDPGFPVPCFVMKYRGKNYLFDAGENSQTQLARYGISRVKISNIMVSHMHGDHTLGLPGILIRRGQEGSVEPLGVFGPYGLDKYIYSTQKYLQYRLHYELNYTRCENGQTYDLGEIKLTVCRLNHRLETYGFVLRAVKKKRKFYPEKALRLEIPQGPLWGKLQNNHSVRLEDGREITPQQVSDPPPPGPSVAYITDTRPIFNYPEEFHDVDLLIHEAMFLHREKEEARQKYHSTAIEAARVARELGAKQLLLTHFSRRYDSPELLADEAAKIFPQVKSARPGLQIPI